MDVPIVSILGRPNVGKSSLLNFLARKRVAIVHKMPGVTRDRISYLLSSEPKPFELIDTGGIGIPDSQELADRIWAQVQIALTQASLVLFVVDCQEGVMPLDGQIAELLRKSQKPVIVVANKADTVATEPMAAEFYALGLGDPLPASAIHGRGRTELLARICSLLPEAGAEAPEPPAMKLAIVGKQNVGKSTLINTLAREERVIVSESPGTTRDSVDIRFQQKGRTFLAIDTAGIRRQTRLKDAIGFFSAHRAYRSIRRADVVLFLVDARSEITNLERKIADYIAEEARACVIVVNKWDLVEGVEPDQYVPYLREQLARLSFVPISFVSAKTGLNVDETIDLAYDLYGAWTKRMPTWQVNSAVREIVAAHAPPLRTSRPAKVYYAVQVDVGPPKIILFVNEPQLFGEAYRRYLASTLREKLSFSEVPVVLSFRGRSPRKPKSP